MDGECVLSGEVAIDGIGAEGAVVAAYGVGDADRHGEAIFFKEGAAQVQHAPGALIGLGLHVRVDIVDPCAHKEEHTLHAQLPGQVLAHAHENLGAPFGQAHAVLAVGGAVNVYICHDGRLGRCAPLHESAQAEHAFVADVVVGGDAQAVGVHKLHAGNVVVVEAVRCRDVEHELHFHEGVLQFQGV